MDTLSLSARFRSRRDVRLREFLTAVPRRGDTLRVLDVGGRANYWERVGLDFLRVNRIEVDILNLSVDEQCAITAGGDALRYIVGNACALDMADDSYDLCHANSVIEHVGLAREMEQFAREVRRVAPAYFIQSPNFWFPVDPHFWKLPLFHWLPRPARARLLRHLPLAYSGRAADMAAAYRAADSSNMLSRTHMRCLFPDAQLLAERFAGVLAKSYTAVRSRR